MGTGEISTSAIPANRTPIEAPNIPLETMGKDRFPPRTPCRLPTAGSTGRRPAFSLIQEFQSSSASERAEGACPSAGRRYRLPSYPSARTTHRVVVGYRQARSLRAITVFGLGVSLKARSCLRAVSSGQTSSAVSGLPVVGGVSACRHAVWQHFRSSLSFRAAYRTTIVQKTFRERDFRFDEVNQSAPLTVREADYAGPL